MDFAMCPVNGGYPRLYRYVEPGSLGLSRGRPIVSVLEEGNLLKIDRELYDQLDADNKHMLLRTHEAFEII